MFDFSGKIFNLNVLISAVGMGFRRASIFDPSKIEVAIAMSLVCAFLTFLMPTLIISQTPGIYEVCAAPVILNYMACCLYFICMFLDIRLKNNNIMSNWLYRKQIEI